MSDNQHISKDDFLAFHNDLMQPAQKEKLLSHICACDYCADQFAASMEEALIPAPRDMKDNILRATRRPEVQLAIRVRETSKRVQLFIYSLKICTATVCALILMMFTMNSSVVSGFLDTTDKIRTEATEHTEHKSLTSVIEDGVKKINSSIVDFSNNLIHKEVTDNDQKEK